MPAATSSTRSPGSISASSTSLRLTGAVGSEISSCQSYHPFAALPQSLRCRTRNSTASMTTSSPPVASNLLPSQRSACARRSGARREPRFRRGRPVGNRELDRERGTPAKVRLDKDPPVHGTHELSTDVEAETAAAHAAPMVRIEPVELFEDLFLLVERDPEPLVGDREADVLVVDVDDDLDTAAVG